MKGYRIVSIFILVSLSFIVFAQDNQNSQEVFSKEGNIYLGSQDNASQITQSGKDTLPVLSPDKKLIAFVRKIGPLIPDNCSGIEESADKHADQIWIYDIASKKERLLVTQNFSCDQLEKMITHVNTLQFSPDGKKLYFQVPAWTTSNALHVVDVNGANQHFLLPALTFEVISKGDYQGDLIVQQHRYFIGGGSYDWYWLFSPDGKEKGAFGEEVRQDQREFLMSEQ